jgi:hypothetical protein
MYSGTEADLKRQSSAKHSPVEFTCNPCKKRFPTKYHLDFQEKNLCNAWFGPCTYCHKRFSTDKILVKHIKDNQPAMEVKENFRCKPSNNYFEPRIKVVSGRELGEN